MVTVTREQKAIAAWTQAMATAENYAIDPHRHIALLVQAGEQMAALLTPGSAATSPPATVPREREELIAKLAEEAAHLAKVATNTWACVARSKRDFDVIGGLHRDIDAVREKLAAALASAPPAAPPEDAPRKAEHLLAASGVFKGHEGLRGLANAASFWVDHPYGTRLYYGDGGMDYLHRDVLMSAVRVLDTLAASAAPPDPPSGQIIKSSDQSAARQSDPPGLVEAVKRALPALMANRPPNGQVAYSQVREAIDLIRAAYDALPASPQAETKGDES